jgi:ATP-binding cassette subfamily B multidrug efflux pump
VLIRLLIDNLRPYRWKLLLLLVLQAGQVSGNLVLPELNAQIIDNGVVTGDTGYIWRVGGIMVGISLTQLVIACFAVYTASLVTMSFGRDVRDRLFHRITAFSQQDVDHFGAPSLITRVTNDVQQVQIMLMMATTLAIAAPLTAIGGVIMALRTDIGLSALLVISLPILTVGLGFLIRRMVPVFRLVQGRIDKVNGVMREQITGMRVVRAFVREPEERDRFRKVNDDLTVTSLQGGRLMSVMFPLVWLVVNVSSVLVVWFGGHQVDSGDLSIGNMVAFINYFTIILMSVMMASFVAMLTPRAAVSAERISEVVDTEPTVHVPDHPVTEVDGHGTLELRDVAFQYPGAEAPVLHDISFLSGPGETTAIIGSTGAGKSTLLNLVPRLYDATGGAVLIDGVDVRDLEPSGLWDRIGLVPQKPYLFTGTVATNLRFGNPDATDEELWEALEVAQAADFVAAMPGGLDARISQGGTNVSGGQRQRLAIARALVRRPEVYLFDDSFSALDLATDARLRAALVPWTVEATVIVVAQRVSTIAGADRIVVLDEGRIVGIGRHDELLETCETYAEIVASQVQEVAA